MSVLIKSLKVAVYGDSFAADYDGWPKFLELIFNHNSYDCKITTYAIPGISADYCYAKFLETHKKYDMVIFLWTSLQRSSIITIDKKNYHNSLTDKNSIFKYHANVMVGGVKDDFIKESISNSTFISKKYNNIFSEITDLIKKWITVECYLTVDYFNKNVLKHLAMRDSVKFNRPDSINIEVFDGITGNNRFMANVQYCDLFQYKKNTNCMKENYSIRKNHLTLTQNMEFAKYLFQHINGEIDVHDTFTKPEKYYTMSKTLEESGFIM